MIVNLSHLTWQLRRAEKLNREALLKLQDVKFRKLLRHAFRSSQFYREFYGDHGITEKDLDKIPLRELPLADKKIVMENFDRVITEDKGLITKENIEKFIDDKRNSHKKFLNKYKIIHSSGTSGTVGIFVYGPEAWDFVRAVGVNRIARPEARIFQKTRIAFIGTVDGHYAGVSLARDAPSVFYKFLPVSIQFPMDTIVNLLNEFQPDQISGHSRGIFLLAQQKIKGTLNINPSRIICGGELLYDYMKDRIREAFGVTPTTVYGSSESIIIGANTDYDSSMRLFEDVNLVEVLDGNNNPSLRGKVVLTNLYNYSQPLIRYTLGDEIEISGDSGGKSPFPVIKNIYGREEDILWFEKENGGKEFIHPLVLAEFFVPGIKRFQFIQKGPKDLLMKAVVKTKNPDIISLIKNRVAEILREKGLDLIVNVHVELVNSIKKDSRTGKFRLATRDFDKNTKASEKTRNKSSLRGAKATKQSH